MMEAAHRWCDRLRRVLTRCEKQASRYLGFVRLTAVHIDCRKVRHARLLPG